MKVQAKKPFMLIALLFVLCAPSLCPMEHSGAAASVAIADQPRSGNLCCKEEIVNCTEQRCTASCCLKDSGLCIACPPAVVSAIAVGAIVGTCAGGPVGGAMIAAKMEDQVTGGGNYAVYNCCPCLCLAGTVTGMVGEAFHNGVVTTKLLLRIASNRGGEYQVIRDWQNRWKPTRAFAWKSFFEDLIAPCVQP